MTNMTAAELKRQEINDRHFTAEAMKEYRSLYKEVENLMAEAEQLIDEHATRVIEDDTTAPDWEHVGDMKHIRQLVKQIVTFLSPEDSE